MIDIEIDKQKPAIDELEVTLIGAGSSAGESVVVHLANNKWMIIDSCRAGGKVLPLYYLDKIDVNLEDVLFVVCTHWHSDHVKGLTDVINSCPNARLVMPAFSDKKKVFETLFKGSISNQSPIAKELHGCLKVIRQREGKLKRPMYLGPRDDIKTVVCNGVNVDLRSFSPSDHARTLYNDMLARSTFEEMADTDLESNMCSSVLDITTNNKQLSVLLGADLECNRADKNNLNCKTSCKDCSEMGWCNIIMESEKYQERVKYNYIKASHHSSVNGYCPELMDNKVDKENTIVTTTVFENGAGVRLPQAIMLQQYLSVVDNYFITARQPKPIVVKDEKTEIEDMKNSGVKKVNAVETECGIVTTRFKINTGVLASNHLWGSARKVDKDVLAAFA